MSAPDRVIDRIRSRIVITATGCWMWTGSTTKGYGYITWVEDGRTVRQAAHRAMYEAVEGQIPDGLDLDHQCHNPASCSSERAVDCPHRRCCNPQHLLPMTRQANLLRGGGIAAQRAATTACPAGHEYTPANTYVDKLGRRMCRECRRVRVREYDARNREAKRAYNREYHARRRQAP